MKVRSLLGLTYLQDSQTEVNMAQEKTYETKIRKLLDQFGAYHVKYFGCAYSQSGTPDLLVCLNGWFVAIEVKADKGKPSALQLHNLKKIDDAGGFAILAYPKDYDALMSLLWHIANNKTEMIELYKPFRERFLDLDQTQP